MAEKVEVFGVRIDNVFLEQTLDIVEEFVLSGSPHLICTPNVEHVLKALDDDEFQEIVNTADLVVPDGAGIVLFSKWIGTPLKEKVAGSDLLPLLCERSAKEGFKVFLFGGREGVPERASEILRGEYENLQVVGTYSPPMNFEDDAEEVRKAVETIKAAKPDILFVALGAPRQEKWIHANKEELDVPVSIGIGAAIDFVAGERKRAPVWMQKANLEWLHRAVSEPRRLWRRALLYPPLFLLMFFELRTYVTQKKWLKRLFTAFRLVLMSAAIFITYCFAVWVRHIDSIPSFFPPWTGYFGPYQSLLPSVLLCYLFAFIHQGMLRFNPHSTPKELVVSSLKATFWGAVSVLVTSFLFKEIYAYKIVGYSRITILSICLLNAVLFFGWQMFWWRLGTAMLKKGLLVDRILVVGTTKTAAKVISNLRQVPIAGVRAIGVLDDNHSLGELFEGVPVVGSIHDFRTIIRTRKVDEVLITDTYEQLEEMLSECVQVGVRMSLASALPPNLLRGGQVSSLGGVTVISPTRKAR